MHCKSTIFKIIILITLAVEMKAQTRLADAELSLTDSVVKTVLGEAARDFPEILINAFKKGELKGYAFGFQKQPVYGELKQWPNPKNWVANGIYDKNDSVLYKGKLYKFKISRAAFRLQGPTIAPDAYGINDYWVEYKRMPPVIATEYILPSEKELLKGEQWEEVKSKASLRVPEWQVPEWQSNRDYYSADQVFYNGKMYKAIRDSKKKFPSDTSAWLISGRSSVPYDSDFTYLKFVFNLESQLPIALQLQAHPEVGIGFYFEAVQAYLLQTKQDVLADKFEGLMRKKANMK